MLTIKALPGKRQEVFDILRTIQEALSLKQDCLACEIYETYGEEDSILYIENWRNGISLNRHIQSDLYRRVLAVMELAAEPPTVSFRESHRVRGMELIMKLREEPGREI